MRCEDRPADALGVRPFFLGVGFFRIWSPEEEYWETLFNLAYHVKGFTHPIEEMPLKMRAWMAKRLVKQSKAEREALERARKGLKIEDDEDGD